MSVQNPDYFQVSLKVLLTAKNKCLILKDVSKSRYWKEKYDLPGGRINKKEIGLDFSQLINREVREELGTKVRYKLRHDPVALSKCRYPKEPSKLFILFEAKYLGGEIKISPEHSSYKWLKITRPSIKNNFSTVLQKLLINYLNWN